MNVFEFRKKFGAFQSYIILIVLIGLALYGGFFWGNKHYSEQQRTIASHIQSIGNLKSENDALTKNLNILGVELEVAKIATKKSFVKIEQGIEREKELRRELAFYQQVMAPELNEQGFLIEGFNVAPALSEHSFRFELVLMQQNKVKNTLKGNLEVLLLGSEGGRSKQYPLYPMLLNQNKNKKALTFSFKYFQVIEGEIKLPKGFIPEKVSVYAEIFQFKRKKGEITSVFDWTPYSL